MEVRVFVPTHPDLRACLGQTRAVLYEREIDYAATQHRVMSGLVDEMPRDARLLFIEMTRRGLAGHPRFADLPQTQKDLYRISHTGSTDPHLPSDTFRYMFGFRKGDARFVVWNLMGGEEDPPIPMAHVDGVILSGSETMVTEVSACRESSRKTGKVDAFLRQARRCAVPVLGVCFSHQWIAHTSGGNVNWLAPAGEKTCEVGSSPLEFTPAVSGDLLFDGLRNLWVQAYHYQGVMGVPQGAITLASNRLTPYQALRYQDLPWWTLQGHPELTGVFGDVAKTIHDLPSEDEIIHETHGLRELLFPRFLGLVSDHQVKWHNPR